MARTLLFTANMPLGAVVTLSVVAAGIAGLATYLVLSLARAAYIRHVQRSVPHDPPQPSLAGEIGAGARPNPFDRESRDRTRTDLLTLPDTAAFEAEPALDLRLAWHVARVAREARVTR